MESLVNEPKQMYTRYVLKFPRITFENLKSIKKFKNLPGMFLWLKEEIFGVSENFTFCPKIVYLWGGGGELLKVLTKTLKESYHIFKVLLEEEK